MRSASFLAFFLAACGAKQPAMTANGAAALEQRIECRLQGARDFAPGCWVETFDSAEGRILTVRKPDGGFRRLRVTADGVVAADGAERAHVTILAGNLIEVEIGGDRFRLPAQVRAR